MADSVAPAVSRGDAVADEMLIHGQVTAGDRCADKAAWHLLSAQLGPGQELLDGDHGFTRWFSSDRVPTRPATLALRLA